MYGVILLSNGGSFEQKNKQDPAALIDHHTGRHSTGHLGAKLGGLLPIRGPLLADVRLKAPVEIVCAHAGIYDGHDDENESDHSEEGQRPAGREIFVEFRRLVHPYELEEEVGHGTEIEKLKDVSIFQWK